MTWRIVAAAGAVIILGWFLLIVLGLAVARGDESPEDFYLEALLRVESSDDLGKPVVKSQRLRWWFTRPSLTRWEIVADDEPIDTSPNRLMIVDGSRIWFYYPTADAYCSLEDNLKGSVLLSPPFGTPAVIGPSAASSLDELVKSLQEIDPSVSVARLGSQMLQGIRVEILEYSPASPSANDSVGTLWVDSSRMVILQHRIEMRSDDSTQTYESAVVDIAFGQTKESDVFSFSTPPGAQEFRPIDNSCDEGLREFEGIP